MTAPASGVARLIHFVDARIAQLRLTKDEVSRRGGPSADTLTKLRRRGDQAKPTIATLARYDAALGWQPGSAAHTLIGGLPQSLTARRRGTKPATPAITEDDIVARFTRQLRDEITRLAALRDDLDTRITRMQDIHNGLIEVLDIDHDASTDTGRAHGTA
jgi:hypothetical protein